MDDDDPIRSIFFERQQAALCAQHALNMLLQDALFTHEDLRVLARRLDDQEQEILGNNANAIGRSENMNDSGFFSIQVIVKALETFSLALTNIENPAMIAIKNNPITARAFVCNLREHWFVLRKFGNQWFRLDSTLNGPLLLSDTYVREYLHQLSAEGYSTFVVQGILPESNADQLISLCPVVQRPRAEPKEPNVVQKFFNSVGKRLGGNAETDSQEDKDLAIAMAMSMERKTPIDEADDKQLQLALAESLKVSPSKPETSNRSATPPETAGTTSERRNTGESDEVTETPILGEHSPNDTPRETPKETPSVEQQRRDREKFLERIERKKSDD